MVPLQQGNVKKSEKLLRIIDNEKENFHIF